MTNFAAAIGIVVMTLCLAASAPAAGGGKPGVLAFAVTSYEGENSSAVYTIRTDGSRLHEVRVPATLDPEAPAWSPDGVKIAFQDVPEGLFVVPAAGGRATKVRIRIDEFRGDPRWSPDGREIAYGALQIATLGKAGNRTVSLPFDCEHPDWSPDGKRLSCIRGFEHDEPGEIYTATVDGSGIRRLTRNGANQKDFGARWSPDGYSLLFIRESREEGAGDFHFPRSLNVIPAVGGQPKKLLRNDGITSASWSPDGKRIAFTAGVRIHLYTLASGTDHWFRPQPCRGLVGSQCGHVDWQWATP